MLPALDVDAAVYRADIYCTAAYRGDIATATYRMDIDIAV